MSIPVEFFLVVDGSMTNEDWLTGSIDEALALQKPAPDDAVRIVATGAKQGG
jgi:hypothetical protein